MKIRQRVGALFAAVLVGLTSALVLATPAHAADYLHRIVSRQGWCIEVPIDPATGLPSMRLSEQLRLSVCGPTSGSWNQKFWFSDGALSNMYFIRPGHNLWCIQPGANISNSTVVQWGCDWGSFLQQFTVMRPEDPGPVQVGPLGPFILKNAQNQLCLTPDGVDIGAFVRVTTNCGEFFIRDSSRSFWDLPYA